MTQVVFNFIFAQVCIEVSANISSHNLGMKAGLWGGLAVKIRTDFLDLDQLSLCLGATNANSVHLKES